MSKEKNKKDSVSFTLFLALVVILILIAVVFYEKTHPKFDEKISGKEATVVTEVAKIHYDDPFGRNVGTVTQSQKFKLTGKIAYVVGEDIVMMEIHLEDNNFAWIYKKDIAISE